jgi:hypothetical protein
VAGSKLGARRRRLEVRSPPTRLPSAEKRAPWFGQRNPVPDAPTVEPWCGQTRESAIYDVSPRTTAIGKPLSDAAGTIPPALPGAG